MLTLLSEDGRGWVVQGSPRLAGVRMQESEPLTVAGEQTWPGGAALDGPLGESLSHEAFVHGAPLQQLCLYCEARIKLFGF